MKNSLYISLTQLYFYHAMIRREIILSISLLQLLDCSLSHIEYYQYQCVVLVTQTVTPVVFFIEGLPSVGSRGIGSQDCDGGNL